MIISSVINVPLSYNDVHIGQTSMCETLKVVNGELFTGTLEIGIMQ